jgi:hypothetical protein
MAFRRAAASTRLARFSFALIRNWRLHFFQQLRGNPVLGHNIIMTFLRRTIDT